LNEESCEETLSNMVLFVEILMQISSVKRGVMTYYVCALF